MASFSVCCRRAISFTTVSPDKYLLYGQIFTGPAELKITKKLEELFNLGADPTSSDTTAAQDLEQHRQIILDVDTAIDKIDAALPMVHDLDATSDRELDDLSDLARQHFEELMSLGMNVEARYSGTIFQTAGMLLGHAIAAKTAKLDRKLKTVDLQLKKARLDQTAEKRQREEEAPLEGQGHVLDRNAIIAEILKKDR
jgi:hypothetical protein